MENCLFLLNFKVRKEALINHHSQYKYHKFLCQLLFYSLTSYPACFVSTHEATNVIKFVHFFPKFTQLASQKLWSVCVLYFIKHGLFCFTHQTYRYCIQLYSHTIYHIAKNRHAKVRLCDAEEDTIEDCLRHQY